MFRTAMSLKEGLKISRRHCLGTLVQARRTRHQPEGTSQQVSDRKRNVTPESPRCLALLEKCLLTPATLESLPTPKVPLASHKPCHFLLLLLQKRCFLKYPTSAKERK